VLDEALQAHLGAFVIPGPAVTALHRPDGTHPATAQDPPESGLLIRTIERDGRPGAERLLARGG